MAWSFGKMLQLYCAEWRDKLRDIRRKARVLFRATGLSVFATNADSMFFSAQPRQGGIGDHDQRVRYCDLVFSLGVRNRGSQPDACAFARFVEESFFPVF